MSTDDQDIMTPSELGQKLVVALRSVSDPQALMQAIADRSILNLRSELTTKLESMDKATTLWHEDLVRVPTEVQTRIAGLRELMQEIIQKYSFELRHDLGESIGKNSGQIEKLNGVLAEHQKAVTIAFEAQTERVDGATKLVGEMVQGRVATLTEVSEERFKSIQIQFTLLKQATEQLDLANKTAIAAALQAQKESAGETQKSSQAAIAKSETSTSEAIKALTTTFNVAISGLTDRYNDIKGRMDRGEGKSSTADPALITMLEKMSQSTAENQRAIASLSSRADTSGGGAAASQLASTRALAIGAIAVGFVAAVAAILPHITH